MDPLAERFGEAKELSTKHKMLAVLDEVELIYESLLSLLASQPAVAADPTANSYLSAAKIPVNPEPMYPEEFEKAIIELAELLAERQIDFTKLAANAQKEVEMNVAIQALVVESDRLKEQVIALQLRLKEAEQVLASALHAARQKTDTIKAADEAQLTLDEIIRYAHRISVGFSASAPPNWLPGDPRRPYPTDLEMRAGILARQLDNNQGIPPPQNQILPLTTDGLTATTREYLGSNAGPYTMSPQPLSQTSMDSPKTPVTASLQREASAEEPDVEMMSSDESTTSSSDDE
ncbi:putative Mediator of RNA polymerase II transcription subunit 4 [Hypsibius exemplaris]|uniref:Mediator of RNA polymerase II transcription subunit 4 n=1 Tax=Hypsibius exemplaris TaxID=2072580 RepID=A0A1W0WE28_HYPEX|nr:putative Mediator of RNA polymerase II transcription subunit 4 [Hypsibius exemplaris]